LRKSEMDKSNNQAFEEDLTEDGPNEDGTAEATEPYDIRETRYRYKDGRYYYDRRPTNASGSIDEELDFDAKWEGGVDSERYVRERDLTLRGASRLQSTKGGEEERLRTADKKTFSHFLEELPTRFDPNPKPLFEKESPHEREGRIYLRRHKIIELIHNITTLMLVERPENPKTFIISHLTALMAVRESYPPKFEFGRPSASATTGESATGVATQLVKSAVEVAAVEVADAQLPRLFTDDNIRATFSLLDLTEKKTTTRKKLRHALQVLGLEGDRKSSDENLEENDDEVIDEAQFLATACPLAVEQAKTFYPRVMLEKVETPTMDQAYIQE